MKKATVEEEERKRELELFLAKASSSTYLNQKVQVFSLIFEFQ